MKNVELNADVGVQGALLERAIRKQKTAVDQSKTLPPLTAQVDLEPEETALHRAARVARHLLGISPASHR